MPVAMLHRSMATGISYLCYVRENERKIWYHSTVFPQNGLRSRFR